MARSAEWMTASVQSAGHVDFWGSVGLGGSGMGANPLGSMKISVPSEVQGQPLNFLTGLGSGSNIPGSGLFTGLEGGSSGSGAGGNFGSGGGALHSGQGPPSSRAEGRNAFAPGDRTWWKLPPLPDPGTDDACIAVSDWLTQIQPIMSDLSDRSWAWWRRVMEVAQKAYLKWQQASRLEKSLVVCDTPPDLLDPRLSRLEARALGMILESLPTRIKDELVLTKALTTTNAVYRILLAFQPGGLGERQKLIANLQEPGAATSARHCSDQLRRWHRWLSRSQDLGVNPPDPAILLAGLDKLCSAVIATNPQLGFRRNISRTQHQLDFNPTVVSVRAYARLLQAEMETLALSGADPDLEEPVKLTKKQRAAALRKEQAEAKGGGKPGEGSASSAGDNNQQGQQAKGGQGNGKGGGNNQGGNGGGKGACRFYASKGGCKMGRNCWSYHDNGKAAAEGRCFNCGATDHKAESCARPKARQTGKGEEQPPRGESGAGSTAQSAGNGGNGGKGNGASEPGAAVAEGSTGPDPKVAKANEAPSQELIAEATKLLKGFRMAAARVVDSSEFGKPQLDEVSTPEVDLEQFYLTKVVREPPKGARGLLDGGATNALRTARTPAELSSCTKTQVGLALGRQAELFLTPVGTLLSADPVAPIAPMGVLAAELGCGVSWEGETCTVIHPKRGRLPVVMINRCPELCSKLTEELISEIEDRRARMMHD